MADFREAFQLGIHAYNEAERARQEIFGLLDEFAEQIHEVSKGQVRINRARRREYLPNLPSESSLSLGAAALASIMSQPKSRLREYDAIVATDSSGKEEELCEYELDERGYPLTLRYAKEYVRCHDREALERGLLKLLAHPETGGKLQRLMNDEQAA